MEQGIPPSLLDKVLRVCCVSCAPLGLGGMKPEDRDMHENQ